MNNQGVGDKPKITKSQTTSQQLSKTNKQWMHSSKSDSSRETPSGGLDFTHPKKPSGISDTLTLPPSAASLKRKTETPSLQMLKRSKTTKSKVNPFKVKDQSRSSFKSTAQADNSFVANDEVDFQISTPLAPAKLTLPKKLTTAKKSNTVTTEKKPTTANSDSKTKEDDEPDRSEIVPKVFLDNLAVAEKEMKTNEGKQHCPFCTMELNPLTQPLIRALKKIKRRDKEYEARQKNEKSSAFTPFDFVLKRPVSNEEKDKFCKLHKTECIIKPDGVKKGYPTTIDFNALPSRIKKFRDELELVIKNQLKSDYRDLAEAAYDELGVNRARSTMSVMLRFEATLPGYYGPRGAAVILDTLTEMFLKTGYLTKHLKSRQLPLEFCQQVLVPEMGFRLIREDMQKKRQLARPIENATEKAKQMMRESCEYGNLMFPVKNQHIESSGEIGHYTITDVDDDDKEDEDGRNDYL